MTERHDVSPPPIATPIVGNAPRELKERAVWVLWRYERTRSRSSWAKVPYQVSKRARARSNDPSTWTTFAQAFAALAPGWGLGFMFHSTDDLMGVDLDGAVDPDTGAAHSWAREIVDTLDSYTEISPSGTGVHILVRARLGHLTGRRRGSIEMYESGRYFTVTGKLLDEAGTKNIESRQGEVETIHARHVAKATPRDDARTPASPLPTDDRDTSDGSAPDLDWSTSEDEFDAFDAFDEFDDFDEIMDRALEDDVGGKSRPIIETARDLDRSIRAGSSAWLHDDEVDLSPTMRDLRDGFVRGLDAQVAGDLGVAVSVFRELVDEHPTFVIAQLGIADGLHQLDRTPEAIEHLAEAILECPNDPALHMRIGIFYGASSDPLREIHHHHRAHAASPNAAGPSLLLASAYRRLGWWHAARAWIEHALAMARHRDAASDPLPVERQEEIYTNWAFVLEHDGSWRDAQQAWRKCYALARNDLYLRRAIRAGEMAHRPDVGTPP